MLIYIS